MTKQPMLSWVNFNNFFGKEYLSSILSGTRVGCFEEFNTNVTNDKTDYLILVNNWVKLKHNFFGKEYLSSILSGKREGRFMECYKNLTNDKTAYVILGQF
jgi:hypothetical protein